MKPFIFACTVCIVLLFASCASTNSASTYSLVETTEDTAAIETRISYPQFDAVPELSAQIAQYVQRTYPPFKADAQKFNLDYADSALQYQFLVSSTITEDDTFIAVLLNTYTYSAGAHGSTELTSFVWNKKTGSLQTIEQASGLSYAHIAQQCRAELRKRSISSDEQWIMQGTQPDAEHFGTFTIHNKRLTVYFAEYQVAPYAAGIQSVSIDVQ